MSEGITAESVTDVGHRIALSPDPNDASMSDSEIKVPGQPVIVCTVPFRWIGGFLRFDEPGPPLLGVSPGGALSEEFSWGRQPDCFDLDVLAALSGYVKTSPEIAVASAIADPSSAYITHSIDCLVFAACAKINRRVLLTREGRIQKTSLRPDSFPSEDALLGSLRCSDGSELVRAKSATLRPYSGRGWSVVVAADIVFDPTHAFERLKPHRAGAGDSRVKGPQSKRKPLLTSNNILYIHSTHLNRSKTDLSHSFPWPNGCAFVRPESFFHQVTADPVGVANYLIKTCTCIALDTHLRPRVGLSLVNDAIRILHTQSCVSAFTLAYVWGKVISHAPPLPRAVTALAWGDAASLGEVISKVGRVPNVTVRTSDGLLPALDSSHRKIHCGVQVTDGLVCYPGASSSLLTNCSHPTEADLKRARCSKKAHGELRKALANYDYHELKTVVTEYKKKIPPPSSMYFSTTENQGTGTVFGVSDLRRVWPSVAVKQLLEEGHPLDDVIPSVLWQCEEEISPIIIVPWIGLQDYMKAVFVSSKLMNYHFVFDEEAPAVSVFDRSIEPPLRELSGGVTPNKTWRVHIIRFSELTISSGYSYFITPRGLDHVSPDLTNQLIPCSLEDD